MCIYIGFGLDPVGARGPIKSFQAAGVVLRKEHPPTGVEAGKRKAWERLGMT